jgi:hypothetical protein
MWETIKNTPIGKSLVRAVKHKDYCSVTPGQLSNIADLLYPEPHMTRLTDESDLAALHLAQLAVISWPAYQTWLDLIEAFEVCESPIERLFLSAVITLESSHCGSFIVHGPKSTLNCSAHGFCLHIYPQHQIGDFRTDFLLRFENEEYPEHAEVGRAKGDPVVKSHALVVECDGHDFHEKTKEQASRDKERDRTLQSCGYPVFRYSGSDLHADVFKCARECRNYLVKQVWGEKDEPR